MLSKFAVAGVLLLSNLTYAHFSYPPDSDTYERLEEAISDLSKKKKAELIEKIYDFMRKNESNNLVQYVNHDVQPTPEWLDSLFWETANARDVSAAFELGDEAQTQENLRRSRWPPQCIYAGNIIATRTVDQKPRCYRQGLDIKYRELYGPSFKHSCGNDVLCNPEIFFKCEGGKRTGDICVNLSKAEYHKQWGRRVTKSCISQVKPAEIAECIKTDDQIAALAKVAEGIKRFCAALEARPGVYSNTKEFAGNHKDCEDLMNYLADLEGRKVKPKPTPEPEQPKIDPDELACNNPGQNGFRELCSGQDAEGLCTPVVYSPSEQKDGCIRVNMSQGNQVYPSEKICKDDIKENQKSERVGRGLNWIHRPDKVDWNRLGRAVGDASDENGALNCYDEDGQLTTIDKFNTYVNTIVKNPEQRREVDRMVNDCISRDNAVVADAKGKRPKERWALIKVANDNDIRLPNRHQGGHLDQSSRKPACTDNAPCTSGTVICAKVDGSQKKIKGAASYFTLYTEPKGSNRYGPLQYFESGSFEGLKGNKTKLENYPLYIRVWDTNDDRPFLTMRDPKKLKGGKWIFKTRNSIVYDTEETLCQNSVSGYNSLNKVIAKVGSDGQVERALVCDSYSGDKYGVFLSIAADDNKRLKVVDGRNEWKGVRAYEHFANGNSTYSHEPFALRFNADTPGSCEIQMASSDTPQIVEFGRFGRTTPKVTPRKSIRTIQSQDK